MAGFYDARRRFCLPDTVNINSKGYFKGDDPLAYAFPVMMIQLIMFFFISRGIYFILKPLRQPVFVSNVLAGIILGPSFLGFHKSFRDKIFPPKELVLLNTLSTLGATLFIFITAVKIEANRILKVAKKAIKVGIPSLIVTFIFTVSLSFKLQKNIPGMAGGVFPFILSVVLSLNYFPVVVPALSELDQLTSDLGQLAMSCTLLDEIFSMLFVATTPAMMGADKMVIIKSEIGFLILLLTAIFVLRPAIHWILKTTPEGKPVNEVYIVGLLVGALIIATFCDIIGKNFVLGVILTGLLIPPGPPLGSQMIDRFELVISHFFLPFFYIRIGQFTNVSSIKNWSGFISFEIIMGGSYLGKLVGSLLSVISIKTSIRNALLFSCILNLKGIIDLHLLLKFRKSMDEQTFTLAVLTHTAITALLTPLVSIYYNPDRKKVAVTQSTEGWMRTIGTTPVNSELRVLCCIHSEDTVHSLITLLKSFNPSNRSPICAYPVHLVELVGRATPLLVPYKTTPKRKIKENSTDRIMRALEKFSMASQQLSIQPFTLIAPYKTMYESINNLVRDKLIPFIILPFNQIQQMQGGGGGGGTANNLRIFNRKIQNYAPCTVGLFVDRGLPRYSISNCLSYNIAVYFLGGADDREVMSLASRMSGNPEISITLFRIHELIEAGEDYSERLLDDVVVNEFKSRNLGNGCVSCHEVEATNTLEAMEAIRSSEDHYDLLVVGKRRRPESKLEGEMMHWADHEELGVIGDLLASQDFCGGTIPVLVIQCVSGINGSSIIGDMTSHGRTSYVSDFSGSMKNDQRI